MIYRKKLFNEILFLSILVTIIHHLASIYSLYYSIDWLDILMHFLGGLLMGFIALFIFFTSEKIHLPRDNKILIFSLTIGFVLVAGLSWELWELFVGFSNVSTDLVDTMFDIVMDFIGGFVAYIISLKNIWTQN